MMDEQDVAPQRGMRTQPERRPRIRPPRTPEEKMVIAMALIGMVALCAFTLYWWLMLPTTIPIPFGVAGKSVIYASKNRMILPLGVQLQWLLTYAVLARYPWLGLYPVRITRENAARQYLRGRLLVVTTCAYSIWLNLVFQIQAIQVARGAMINVGEIVGLKFLALVVVPELAIIGLVIVWAVRGR